MTKRIAYLPLDIPKEDLFFVVQNYKSHPHNIWPDLWDCLPVCGKTDYWDADSFYDAYIHRYDSDKPVNWNVPELKNIIGYFPGKITHAQILNQKQIVPAHKDVPILKKQVEPAGFKIVLNNHLERSFFVKINGKKHFIKLPETTNCFAINESEVTHGSMMPTTAKYVVSCFGEIDEKLHEDLISRSLAKYGGEYGIFF